MHIHYLAAGLAENYQKMKPAVILLAVILAVLVICCFAFSFLSARVRMSHSRRRAQNLILRLLYGTTAVVLLCTVLCFGRYRSVGKKVMQATGDSTISTTVGTGTTATTGTVPTTGSEPTVDTTPVPEPTFTPGFAASSDPKNWGITWEIISGGSIVDNYQLQNPVSFGKPEDYFALPGIATFRGNNFRNSASYGTAQVTEKTLNKAWNSTIGSLNGWPGSGWTGQPLMVQWDAETKKIMNMYPEKQAKEGLVEVIYATLDGNVYFYDLDDGSYTRKPLYLGMNFKGAGSLDPRGYPIMYVGSGDYIGGKAPRLYIVSLIDGSILYERSGNDAFSQRDWVAFDSSPLIDAETDTMIWPGESGILYTMKLNTQYDKTAGTLSMAPDEIVKTRYYTSRSNNSNYWIGYEPSAVIVDRYLYIAENGGMFFCVDLNTMSLVWAQDTRDDNNSTPVFEWNGLDGGYIYTAPSLHWTASGGKGYICIYKLDAKTGEIVWEQRFDCYTVDGVSGGVQSTPLLGKPGTQLEGLILYTIARCPGYGDGKLVALSTETGEVVWEEYMSNYAWSSPVAVYDKDGNAFVIICDSAGKMTMLDGKGEALSSVNLGSNIEASPAVYENTIVVGTRGGLIYGIEIK